MIGGESVVAVITARGGSKGVPGKNVRPVGGKPLLAWTVGAARGSRFVDRVIMSTDDDVIAKAAQDAGAEVPFRRPDALASDTAGSIDVLIHALDSMPPHDWVVLLQPTSPLRTSEDIDGALEQCVRTGAPVCVSVTQAEQSPYWMFNLQHDGSLKPIVSPEFLASRRQDLPEAYTLNGAVYVARPAWIRSKRSFLSDETQAYVMPQNRSLDIDTELDFHLLERLIGASAHA